MWLDSLRQAKSVANNLSNSTKASVEIVAKIMWQYMAKIVTIQTAPEELTLGKFGNIVWQSVALLGIEPNKPSH